MDPNECAHEIERLLELVLDGKGTLREFEENALELHEKWHDLRRWIEKGGFESHETAYPVVTAMLKRWPL